ncbi:MAG: hypothetical protein AAFY26_18395, partial [Cyanobacteria bacterium J06638_22]
MNALNQPFNPSLQLSGKFVGFASSSGQTWGDRPSVIIQAKHQSLIFLEKWGVGAPREKKNGGEFISKIRARHEGGTRG